MTTAIHTEIEEIGRLSARSGYSESMFAFQFAVIHIRRYIEIVSVSVRPVRFRKPGDMTSR